MTHFTKESSSKPVIESLEQRRLFAGMFATDVSGVSAQTGGGLEAAKAVSPPALVSRVEGVGGGWSASLPPPLLPPTGWSFPVPTLGKAPIKPHSNPLVKNGVVKNGVVKTASKPVTSPPPTRSSGHGPTTPKPVGAGSTTTNLTTAADTLPVTDATVTNLATTINTVGTVSAKITTPYGTNVTVGSGLHVNGIASVLSSGSAFLAKYHWDFGDPNGRFNTMDGFNAAHVYDTPGQYRVTLTVTDSTGAAGSTSMTVNVLADTRRQYFVSPTGSDSNDGLDSTRPLATVQKALALSGGSNAAVLLQRGGTFDLTGGAITVSGNNVLIGAYGTGAAPVIRKANDLLSDLVLINSTASNVTIQDVSFDTTTPTNLEKAGAARGVKASGTNIVVRRCTFTNVSDAVNGEQQPRGVIVQDNVAPTVTSVRGYFDWVQGSDWVIMGNNVPNSTREHIVRVGGADRVTAQYNTFSNQDRTAQGDSKDIAKGTFTLQIGTYISIEDNNLWWGPMGVGPLGGTDGSGTPTATTTNVVFRGNKLYGGSFNVSPGAYNVLFQDNVITANGFSSINITPNDTAKNASGALIYPTRNIGNLVFDHNTGFSNSNNGRFITLNRASDPGQITVTSNLYVAPKLETGYNQNAVLYLQTADLSSFKEISGNIWAAPAKSPNNNAGAAVYLWPSWWDASGYRTPSQWASLQPRNGGPLDLFSNVNMPDPSVQVTVPAGSTPPTYAATVNGVTAGARITR